MAEIIMRLPEVQTAVGVGRSTLYDWMKAGTFPRPVKLGARAIGWRQAEILAWLDSREAA